MAQAQDPRQKIEIAKQKKETADQAFKKGDLQSGMFDPVLFDRIKRVL